MIKTISKTIVFIPKFDRNRELTGEDQIRVLFNAPTTDMKSRAIAPLKASYELNAQGQFDKTVIETETKDNYTAGSLLLKKIENCGYEDEYGSKAIITNWQDLIKSPVEFSPLLSEICEEAERMLKEPAVNAKNSA